MVNTNIKVSPNEIFNKYTLNRNFLKLIENDQKISDLIVSIGDNIFNLQSYKFGYEYQLHDFCLYTETYNDTVLVFILQNIINNNRNKPILKIINNNISFIESGWDIKNSSSIFLASTINEYVNSLCKKQLYALHENDLSYHKYGKIRNLDDLESKILKKDFSNIDSNRSKYFYPNETIQLQPNNVIQSGYYKKWDSGLLEYDIVYKLSYVKSEINDYIQYDVLKCNDVTINDSDSDVNDTSYNENKKYFADNDAKTIFKFNASGESIIDNIKQINRHKYVNAYSATIEFPIIFKDINYMIFDSNITNQVRNITSRTIDSASNKVVYLNKCRKSITPMYLMFDLTDNPDNAGLLFNSFHCKIVGRWK